ncbi:hypothetical protein E2C01_075922 [Portunus trituberculatus]|uniref:Uncharacterized protein n=1 Tax=Portunus trituberculatus TaxID=210409 RepID=A0A5B7IGB5_PORTR|nr:hypothetical protein [Portunus trituberculatus]
MKLISLTFSYILQKIIKTIIKKNSQRREKTKKEEKKTVPQFRNICTVKSHAYKEQHEATFLNILKYHKGGNKNYNELGEKVNRSPLLYIGVAKERDLNGVYESGKVLRCKSFRHGIFARGVGRTVRLYRRYTHHHFYGALHNLRTHKR